MKSNSHDDDPLEALLAASYDQLRRPVAGERQAILAGMLTSQAGLSTPQAGPSTPRTSQRGSTRRVGRIGTVSLATAACILALVGVWLLTPSATAVVYGVEALGRRLCEVQTIRIRGWQYFYNDRHPEELPTRIPIEYVVKRPDKFRSTFYGVSYGEKVVVKTSTQFCDGRQKATIYDTDKTFFVRAISPLDAQLDTESRAQGFLVAGRLTSPLTGYKTTGEGHCNGRKCDLYEGVFAEESGTRRTKLWFDPATGFPLRLTDDELQPDGSFRLDTEYEEILVNVPLADELFRLTAPAGYQQLGPVPQESDPPPALSVTPSASGQSGRIHAACWNALRIADNAVLVIWRRSAPEAGADGTQDWLSHVEWKLGDEASGLTAQHTWLYNSKSPDIWNWSLMVMTDGRWPDPGTITLQVHTKAGGQLSLGMLALWFPDDELRQILSAVADVMLPADAPRFSLEAMRAKANELSNDAVAR